MRIGCCGQAAALQVKISAETYATGPRASDGEASNSFQPEDTLVFPCFSFFPRPVLLFSLPYFLVSILRQGLLFKFSPPRITGAHHHAWFMPSCMSATQAPLPMEIASQCLLPCPLSSLGTPQLKSGSLWPAPCPHLLLLPSLACAPLPAPTLALDEPGPPEPCLCQV